MKKAIRLQTKKNLPDGVMMAIYRGDWGLHPTQGGCSAWTISHIPTGLKLVSLNSCLSARKCLKEVSAQPYQWDGQGEVPVKFIDTFKPIAMRYLGE